MGIWMVSKGKWWKWEDYGMTIWDDYENSFEIYSKIMVMIMEL